MLSRSGGIANFVCGKSAEYSDKFTPLPHQKFIADHFSKSNTRGLLMMHDLGSGKCVAPGTRVRTASGDSVAIEDIWGSADPAGDSAPSPDGGVFRHIHLEVDTPSGAVQAAHAFRMPVSEYMQRVITSAGSVSKTAAHALWRHRCAGEDTACPGWATDIVPGDVLVKAGGVLCVVEAVEEYQYDGYVYDLDVPDTMTYYANDFLSHNTCSSYSMARACSLVAQKDGSYAYSKAPIYIIGPAALRDMHAKEFCGKCGTRDMESSIRYIAINDTANLLDIATRTKFDGATIIVDEAHLLITGATSASSTTIRPLYNAIRNARAIRLILLTATPVYRKPQFATLLELLEPGITANTEINDDTPAEQIAAMFAGLVSFSPGVRANMPDVEYDTCYKNMSLYQMQVYDDALRVENTLMGKKGNDRVSDDFYNNTRMRTRTVCNFAYPPAALNSDASNAAVHSTIYLQDDATAAWIDEALNPDGKNPGDWLYQYSPKFAALVNTILANPDVKHYVFTQFTTHAGTILLKRILDLHEVRAAVFSGEEDLQERQATLKAFNSKSNLHGEKIQVLIVSKAGAAGISLRDVRIVHILDASINYANTRQAIGRAIRNNSHSRLPEEERNVLVREYLTFRDESQAADEPVKYRGTAQPKSTEIFVHNNSVMADRRVREVLERMKEVSVDCVFRRASDTTVNCVYPKQSRLTTNKVIVKHDVGEVTRRLRASDAEIASTREIVGRRGMQYDDDEDDDYYAQNDED